MKLPESNATISKTWRVILESEADAQSVFQWLDRVKIVYYLRSWYGASSSRITVWMHTTTPEEDLMLQLKFADNMTLTDTIYIPKNTICTLSEVNIE